MDIRVDAMVDKFERAERLMMKSLKALMSEETSMSPYMYASEKPRSLRGVVKWKAVATWHSDKPHHSHTEPKRVIDDTYLALQVICTFKVLV